jgi:hypothetical protein
MVALKGTQVMPVSIEDATSKMKALDSEIHKVTKALFY